MRIGLCDDQPEIVHQVTALAQEAVSRCEYKWEVPSYVSADEILRAHKERPSTVSF